MRPAEHDVMHSLPASRRASIWWHATMSTVDDPYQGVPLGVECAWPTEESSELWHPNPADVEAATDVSSAPSAP
jgi:hypothetical protein